MKRTLPLKAWHVLLVLALLLPLLSLAFTLRSEFGPWRDSVLQVDEMHFAACAARAQATGQMPNAGCHDNKAPLIYNLHQLIYVLAGGYDAVAIKCAAYLCLVALLALTALLAGKCAGWPATCFGVVPVLCVLLQGSNLHALKTETVGMLFVCGGMLALLPASGRLSPRRLMGAGLLLGLAILTKQTYVLLFPALGLWLCLLGAPHQAWTARIRRALPALLLCGLSALSCFLLVWAAFSLQGNAEAFLANYFLYPSVYAKGPPASLRELAYRLEAIARWGAYRHEFFVLLFVAALTRVRSWTAGQPGLTPDSPAAARWLVLCLSVPIALPLVLAPKLFDFHPVPVWLMMAPLVGTVSAELWSRASQQGPDLRAALLVVLLSLGLLTFAQVWSSNGGRGDRPTPPGIALEASAGRFGYFLGMPKPEFYFSNGLIPASDVLYPWALPGMKASWVYTPPRGNGQRAALIRAQQARNLTRLFEDFRRTPPAYIAVLDEPEWTPQDSAIHSVPGFMAYLQAHCHPLRSDKDAEGRTLQLYRCEPA